MTKPWPSYVRSNPDELSFLLTLPVLHNVAGPDLILSFDETAVIFRDAVPSWGSLRALFPLFLLGPNMKRKGRALLHAWATQCDPGCPQGGPPADDGEGRTASAMQIIITCMQCLSWHVHVFLWTK